ncbi:MAG: hypothetical protein ACJ8C4_13605 [Gemmataceae bacterium]
MMDNVSSTQQTTERETRWWLSGGRCLLPAICCLIATGCSSNPYRPAMFKKNHEQSVGPELEAPAPDGPYLSNNVPPNAMFGPNQAYPPGTMMPGYPPGSVNPNTQQPPIPSFPQQLPQGPAPVPQGPPPKSQPQTSPTSQNNA